MSTPVNLRGRLVRDPELRFTQQGDAMATFTVVTAKRYKDKNGEWQETGTSFWNCTAFKELAENICEHLEKGSQVIVSGTMQQDNYTTREGEKRTGFKVLCDDVAASVKSRKIEREPVSAGFAAEPPF